MADALPTLEINMHHQNIRPRHALPDNEIERALILLPEHATLYRDPRFVAVAWTVDPSNTMTAQVLGRQRRCLPFLDGTCRPRPGLASRRLLCASVTERFRRVASSLPPGLNARIAMDSGHTIKRSSGQHPILKRRCGHSPEPVVAPDCSSSATRASSRIATSSITTANCSNAPA